MPVPDILVGTECRTQMLHGFESMARVLAVTLGPLGGTVINQRVNSTEPELLADGATILRRITELPDRVETVGAMLMRHIVWHMRKEYGDGSATAAVLARSIGRDLHRLIVAGADPISLQRGVEKGVQAASSALTDLALPLEKADHISGLANAAVHEPEISKLLGEIYEVLGPYGNVILQPGYGVGHDTAFRTGSRFPGEYLSRHLLSDTLRHIAALSEPYVLVADIHFNTAEDVAPVLELVAQAEGKHLFIICKNMWEKAIDTLVINNRRGQLTAYAATIKPIEDLRRDMMRDIALLTGATFITDAAGMSTRDLTIDDLGYADRIVATDDYVMIVGGRGEERLVQERCETLHRQMLRSQLHQVTKREEKERLWERIGRLQGGIGELYVGAYTEHERTALLEKAAHAVKVVQTGMEGGIVPGGGAAYLAAIPAVEAVEAQGDEAMGVQVVARALEEPLRVIAENVHASASLVVAECREKGSGYGFDVHQRRVANICEEQIFDSTIIIQEALNRAASGAMMLATAETLVLRREPPQSVNP